MSDVSDKKITRIFPYELPYPSLNEINFTAFGETTPEYHNELYGFIDEKGLLSDYKKGKGQRKYIRADQNKKEEQKTLTEYIRHQIHHPENKLNIPFTNAELHESIVAMRSFIQGL